MKNYMRIKIKNGKLFILIKCQYQMEFQLDVYFKSLKIGKILKYLLIYLNNIILASIVIHSYVRIFTSYLLYLRILRLIRQFFINFQKEDTVVFNYVFYWYMLHDIFFHYDLGFFFFNNYLIIRLYLKDGLKIITFQSDFEVDIFN